MSNVGIIIEEKAADIGNFLVGRLLPFKEKRMAGPFIFLDHMGPAVLTEEQSIEVGPHPHIGLSTLTYLFEGGIMHRDSLGNELEIVPGEVNWMTAGKGVTHSERTPKNALNESKILHGLQMWVALPKELEECEPSFQHVEKQDLPTWNYSEHVQIKLIAGEFMGHKSPVNTHSPLYFIEIKAQKDEKINIGNYLFGETAMYILNGSIIENKTTFGTQQLLVAKESSLCEFTILADSIVYIFGGEVFPEERYILWNFVSSSKDKLYEARELWKQQKFPKVINDNDYVPLPTFYNNYQLK